jgi:hypothetical protein
LTDGGARGKTKHRVGDALPAVLLLSDLAELLGLGMTRVWELERAGDFAHLEILPRVGKRARYSGKKVQAWIDGEADAAATAAAALTTRARFHAAGRRK